jgi:phage I-like protein
MLAAREYRFISPVFEFEKKSRRVARIRSVALTNTPALYLTAIARQEESRMDPKLKAVLDALGLGNDADKDAVEKALARLTACATALATVAKAAGADEKAEPADIATALCAAIEAGKAGDKLTAIARAAGLKETATPEEIAAAVATARAGGGGDPDPSKYVPRSEFDQVKTALATLQSESAEEKATAAADEAIGDGKVTPAQRDWAVAYARKDAEGFAGYVKTAPVIVKPGSSQTSRRPAQAGAALDAEELAICRVTGTDPETFKKQRDEIAREEEVA